VEHWLNGTKVVEYELWSPDWKRRVKESKFVEWPEYGMAHRGHIALQDHGDEVSFRSIRIKVLP
jgi:3-keto-disaccharide hydrolase